MCAPPPRPGTRAWWSSPDVVVVPTGAGGQARLPSIRTCRGHEIYAGTDTRAQADIIGSPQAPDDVPRRSVERYIGEQLAKVTALSLSAKACVRRQRVRRGSAYI